VFLSKFFVKLPDSNTGVYERKILYTPEWATCLSEVAVAAVAVLLVSAAVASEVLHI
jgi:hypothetical protein